MRIRLVLAFLLLFGAWMGSETYSTMCAEKTWLDFQQDFTWISRPSLPGPEASVQPSRNELAIEGATQGSEEAAFSEIERATNGIVDAIRKLEMGAENLDGAGRVALRIEKTENLLEKLTVLRNRIFFYAAEYEMQKSPDFDLPGEVFSTAEITQKCGDPSSKGLLKMIGLARSFLRAANSDEMNRLEVQIQEKEGKFLGQAVLVIDQIDRLNTVLNQEYKKLDSETRPTPWSSDSSSGLNESLQSGLLAGEVESFTRKGRSLLSNVFSTSEFALRSFSTKKIWFWGAMGLYGLGAVLLIFWYVRSLMAVTVAMGQVVDQLDAPLRISPITPFLTIKTLGEVANNLANARSNEFNRISAQKKRESEIAGAVAHEYGNNIMVIEGLLSMATGAYQSGSIEDVGVFLEKAMEGCNTAKSIVVPLRESGDSNGNKNVKGISLKRILQDETSKLASENEQQISLKLDPKCGGVRVDEDDFLSIIRNLIMNAQDSNSKMNRSRVSLYTHPLERLDSEIVMRLLDKTEAGVEFVCIEVKDEGIGIPEEIGNKVFDLGYSTKSDQERKKQPGAKGCGLHIAWNKVKENDGVIDFIRNASGGVTFRVFLPKALEYEIELPTEKSEQVKNPTVGGEILLVEDNPQVREVVEYMLKARGYTATSVPSAEAALIQLQTRDKKSPFSRIISDINLGIDCMSGHDLVLQLRDSQCNTPVLLITAYHKHEITTILDPAVHNYRILEKPFTPIQLYETLDRITDPPIDPFRISSDDGDDREFDLGEPVSA